MKISIETLNKAKILWGVNGSPTFIRDLQNAVYRISISDESAVLRLTNSNHRNILELKQEVEWTLFLSNNGCNVARPIKSASGNFIETIKSGNNEYFSSVFSFALGRPIEEAGVLCPETLIAWGKELGKIHDLSACYVPKYQRDSYYSIKKYSLDSSAYSDINIGISNILNIFDKWINGLPRDQYNYGMIHGDSVNFHIDEKEVTFFDFDDCTYHWFSFDIANGLYSLLFIIHNEGIDCSLTFDECVDLFLQGYRKEKDIEQVWVNRIPCFVKYRTALLCQWLKTPEIAPAWVLNMDIEWRNKLEQWAEKNLASELNLV
ncbi:MAG: phosphotransferase [Francisellaceae bacterium]|nr:phosphotransferase [Francisellaceae bacterium]